MDAQTRMVETIEHHARLTGATTGRERLSPAVLDAVRRVPRDAFVPDDLAPNAWDDRPLPIGSGQTISQPFIVALMTDLLDPRPGDRMLEVGTGCGYQAAVLAQIVRTVYSIEFVRALGEAARTRLQGLAIENVRVGVGDGCAGWPEEAPFDGVIVTAAAPRVPPALIEQLAPNGRMVVPLDTGRSGQQLYRLSKDEDGRVSREPVLPVAFVPLQGGAACSQP